MSGKEAEMMPTGITEATPFIEYEKKNCEQEGI